MKKPLFLSLFFLFILLMALPTRVQADDSNSITITKYKLTDELVRETSFPIDGTEVKEMVGPNGEELELLPGINYLVERVTIGDTQNKFKPLDGENAFKVQIVTDASGVAFIGDLIHGMYRITEEKNKKLSHVMEPVILELPLPRTSGNSLSDVYLYPKSSFSNEGASFRERKDGVKSTGKLPRTSGNIGNFFPIFWSILLVFLMGIVGFYLIIQKKDNI